MATPIGEEAAKEATVKYRLDAAQSKLTVQAFAEGLLSAFGHSPVFLVQEFSGEAQINPETLANPAARVVASAHSLTVIDDVKAKDRQEIERTLRNEVLEVDKYPEIVFQSTNISLSRIGQGRHRVRIIGDLTLHGVTQSNLWIYAEGSLSEDNLRVSGDFTLKQSDFQIKRVSVAGGTLRVKNEVKVTFDITGNKVD